MTNGRRCQRLMMEIERYVHDADRADRADNEAHDAQNSPASQTSRAGSWCFPRTNMPENLATKYLREHAETVDDWDGICGELAKEISTDDDHIIYVEGDIPWYYHMVMMRDGLIHDAWCEGDALPVRDWLIAMFGADTYLEVALNGDDIFQGHAGQFDSELLEKSEAANA